MNERLLQFRDSFLRFWNQYSARQRMLFIGAFLISVLTLVLLVYHFSKTEYSVAFTNLDPTDAANIKGYLEANNIPYKLSTDGRTIGVPSTIVSEVKIDVASQGLITNGAIGYEIFRENMSSWSMTDSQFEVLNTDARAGEIQRLINQISGVVSSKVLINMPKPSVFLSPDGSGQQASASVVVTFQPGFPPDQQKIDTIYNLVAKSVPNLSIDNITISDQNGELLPSSKLGAGGGLLAGQIEQQLRIKKQFELDLQRNVASFLTPLVGANNVIVSVFSTLNFDQKTSEENLVTPVNLEDGTGITVSREINEESVTSGGGEIGGTPGTGETDIPGYPGLASAGIIESERSNRIENFDFNRIRNQIISSPYVVQDLTISVGLNVDPGNPDAVTEETVRQVERLLMNIVAASLANSGLSLTEDALRSRVSVIARNFQGAQPEADAPTFNEMLLYGLAGAAIAALLGGGALFLHRRRVAQARLAEEEQLLAEKQKPEEPVLDIDTVDDHQVRRQLEQLARRRPEVFVNLLRTWLVDE